MYFEDEEVTCGACGGEPVPLGRLGDLSHYRCRDCGSTFFITAVRMIEPEEKPAVELMTKVGRKKK